MNRTRSISLWSVVFLAAFLTVAWAGTAAAAPDTSSLLVRANNAAFVDEPVQPTFAIPGIFSLTFGDDASQAAQIDLPSLNATATVAGLTLGPTLGWNAITVSQVEPAVTDAATISGLQMTVGGPESGYSAYASTQFDLHPGPGFQAEGTVGVVYDGMNKQAGLALQDTSAMISSKPMTFELSGINTQSGTMTIDSAQVGIPATGATVTMEGIETGSGGTQWDSLVFAQSPGATLRIGDVAEFSDITLLVPGAGTDQATVASADFEVNAGDVVQVEGTVLGVSDRTGGPSGVALQDTDASFQIAGWNLQLTGINSIQGGATIDSVSLAAEPINLTAEVTGVTVGEGGGMAFDEAQITYLPLDESGQPTPGAFQMKMTRSDAGYILTTATLLPIAAR